MRGFPLLRIAVVATALLLLGVPVWMLTGDRVQVAQDEAGVDEGMNEMVVFSVELTSSAPARLSVMAAGHPVQVSDGPLERFEGAFEMPRSQPEDLVVSANFEGEVGSEALRVNVRESGRLVADKTFWGVGEIQDVLGIVAP